MTVAARLRTVTIIIALGCVAGMLCSHRAWVSAGTFSRVFPNLPIFDGMHGLARPWHLLLAGTMLALLLVVFLLPTQRIPQLLAVACGIVLMMFDQSRVQPWLLQYLLMLLVLGLRTSSSGDDRHALTLLRWIIAFLYIFS